MNGRHELPGDLVHALSVLLAYLRQPAADKDGAAAAENDDGRERSPWLSLEAAAAYLDWPRQRLYKLTARGEIPHYKHEGRLAFRRDELDRWLAGYAQGERDWMNGGESS